MSFELECPVDFKKVNENKVRLTALWVLLLTSLFTITQWWIIIAFLIVDFSFRAFDLGNFSLLHKLSDFIVKLFKIADKPIDQAPKVFAAGVGLAFTLLILVLTYGGFPTAALVLAIILIFFALLESAFNFCAGCFVYTFYKKLT